MMVTMMMIVFLLLLLLFFITDGRESATAYLGCPTELKIDLEIAVVVEAVDK